MHVSEMVMNIAYMECSNLSRWDFFIEQDVLLVVNTLTVAQFLLYWMRIICCIYNDFVRQMKACFPSFCHSCACEKPREWGHLITWTDPSVAHLKGSLARVGENLNNKFSKKSNALGGGMLKLLFDRYICNARARRGSANKDWATWEILHRAAHCKHCLFVILMRK